MKKNNLKKIITCVVMLAVLGALIGGTAALKHWNRVNEEKEEEDTSVTVIDKSGLTVTKLAVSSSAGELSFTYENDRWVYDGDADFPVNQDKLSDMAQTLAKISASAKVDPDDQGELSEYGLDDPAVSASAEFSDGTSVNYSFGSINSYKDCQYFTVSGDDIIYLADTSVASSLTGTLDSLCQSESFPLTADGVTADDVKSIYIENAEGVSNEITDADGIEELLGYVKVLNLTGRADYYADSAEMAEQYGISEGSGKITVTYIASTAYTDEDGNDYTGSEEKVYTLRTGKAFVQTTTDSDGGEGIESCVYYSPENSDMVYFTDKTSMDAVFDFLDYIPAEDSGEE